MSCSTCVLVSSDESLSVLLIPSPRSTKGWLAHHGWPCLLTWHIKPGAYPRFPCPRHTLLLGVCVFFFVSLVHACFSYVDFLVLFSLFDGWSRAVCIEALTVFSYFVEAAGSASFTPLAYGSTWRPTCQHLWLTCLCQTRLMRNHSVVVTSRLENMMSAYMS